MCVRIPLWDAEHVTAATYTLNNSGGVAHLQVTIHKTVRLFRKYMKMCQNYRFAVEIRTPDIFRIQILKVTATQTFQLELHARKRDTTRTHTHTYTHTHTHTHTRPPHKAYHITALTLRDRYFVWFAWFPQLEHTKQSINKLQTSSIPETAAISIS